MVKCYIFKKFYNVFLSKIFPENKEEHMIPSIREVERKIFEQKGSVTNLELLEIYNKSIKELQAIDLNTETKLKDFNQN